MMLHPNGILEEGNFEGMRNSKFYRKIDPNSCWYQGEIQNNLPHGQGTQRDRNRTIFIGKFLNGKWTHEGKKFKKNGSYGEKRFDKERG